MVESVSFCGDNHKVVFDKADFGNSVEISFKFKDHRGFLSYGERDFDIPDFKHLIKLRDLINEVIRE